jgi:hypothetical protein
LEPAAIAPVTKDDLDRLAGTESGISLWVYLPTVRSVESGSEIRFSSLRLSFDVLFDVGANLYITPLIELAQRDRPFYGLDLSRNNVRETRGSRYR